ncbi:hypothetical protein RRF57_005975 [Xylaria bambusicola]|uniref:Uncharacterized protein n=1 Tax=Xylaria bambusicola TaxID=326684 RepID=A0AAN7Z9K3_9PEZI
MRGCGFLRDNADGDGGSLVRGRGLFAEIDVGLGMAVFFFVVANDEMPGYPAKSNCDSGIIHDANDKS